MLGVLDANLTVGEAPAEHVDDLEFDVGKNGFFGFGLFDNFFFLAGTVETGGVFVEESFDLEFLFEFF